MIEISFEKLNFEKMYFTFKAIARNIFLNVTSQFLIDAKIKGKGLWKQTLSIIRLFSSKRKNLKSLKQLKIDFQTYTVIFVFK